MRGLLSLGLLSTDEMPRLQSDAADLSWVSGWSLIAENILLLFVVIIL